jgi:hypothetical protein
MSKSLPFRVLVKWGEERLVLDAVSSMQKENNENLLPEASAAFTLPREQSAYNRLHYSSPPEGNDAFQVQVSALISLHFRYKFLI